ncbi:hypothetical protein HYW94_02940 [Candidatus Uhrbacteria bacterium]|nr:hypothetical protein [Candidatus Uhrbacteria bacterium]
MAPEYLKVPVEVLHREFTRVEEGPKPSRVNKRERGKASLAEAKEIMKEKDFIGPDALKTIFGIEVKDVPPIPFSAVELTEAKERGEFLILRMDALPGGKPLTMQNLDLYFAGDFKALHNPTDDWKVKSEFFTKETPRVSWALVSKELIQNSTIKNYYDQTIAIRDHLKNEVFKGGMSREYEDAIQEFEAWVNATFPGKTSIQIKAELQDNNKWQQYAERLANLKINQMCRQSGVDVLFDLAAYYKHNGVHLLPSTWTWTKSRDSDGRLVLVGVFDAVGAHVGRYSPDVTVGLLGVLLSRTA